MKIKILLVLVYILNLNHLAYSRDTYREINQVGYDHSGNYVVTASVDETLKIWDRNTGKLLKIITYTHDSWTAGVEAFTISHDDKYIAVTIYPFNFKLYSFPDGKEIETAVDKGSESMTYLPNGNLAILNREGIINIWDMEKGVVSRTFKPGQSIYNDIVVSPDGKYLLVTAPKDFIKLYDLESASKKEIFKTKINGRAKDLDFSFDSKLFAVAGTDLLAEIYDVESKKIVQSIPSGSYTSDGKLCFSPDGNNIITGGDGRSIVVFNIITGKEEQSYDFESHSNCLAASPDGKSVLSGCTNNSAYEQSLVDASRKTFESGKKIDETVETERNKLLLEKQQKVKEAEQEWITHSSLCTHCDGKGQVWAEAIDVDIALSNTNYSRAAGYTICSKCKGSGRVSHDKKRWPQKKRY